MVPVSAMINYAKVSRREAATKQWKQVSHCDGVTCISFAPLHVSNSTAGRHGGEATER